MVGKDYFILGCKLFGIYCLVLGIPGLIAVIPTFMEPAGLGAELHQLYMVTAITTRMIPVIYIVAGLYLLFDGKKLFQLAYPAESENAMDIKAKFTIFVKMLGIYLVIAYFPDLLKSISSYFAYTNVPAVYRMAQEQQFAYLNAASSIFGVVFGFYLLKSGNFIINMAMKSITENKENKDIEKA
jgi:hypothetical protein